jgi:acyl dehydratase
MTITVNGIEELKALTGQIIGPSDWREVTQADIDTFADLARDHQWIHVDVERAKTESPFGTTIAHGNLTLSMIDGFRPGLLESTGFKLGVNYGWDRVRFPAPVPAGSRIRASVETLSVAEKGGGWPQIVQRWTVEVEGSEKPACVADSVGRVLA